MMLRLLVMTVLPCNVLVPDPEILTGRRVVNRLIARAVVVNCQIRQRLIRNRVLT